ncbi:MAG: hypothetical protein PHX62_05955 [Bacilli bacterium]|nr:hypothetical protein [Bacilli bacterium]
MILNSESSIRTAKATLEKSRDSLRDNELEEFQAEIKQAGHLLKDALESVESISQELKK